MHPAPSIILFSTFSGAGFGLMAILSVLPLGDMTTELLSAALAIGLCLAGLVASTFHLGRPERAWRALTQWRSSWLSREGILSLATLAAFAALIATDLALGRRIPGLAFVTVALAGSAVYATGMIYASLRSVPIWHDALTPWIYVAFSAASGAILAAVLRVWSGDGLAISCLALLLVVIAWAVKILWWVRAREKRRLSGTSPETATGMGWLGRVRLFEAPHTSPNYLLKEMVFRIGRKHATRLRTLALVLGGVLPTALITGSITAGGSAAILVCAAVSHFAGLVAERWLFFAEAEHAVGVYYGLRNLGRA